MKNVIENFFQVREDLLENAKFPVPLFFDEDSFNKDLQNVEYVHNRLREIRILMHRIVPSFPINMSFIEGTLQTFSNKQNEDEIISYLKNLYLNENDIKVDVGGAKVVDRKAKKLLFDLVHFPEEIYSIASIVNVRNAFKLPYPITISQIFGGAQDAGNDMQIVEKLLRDHNTIKARNKKELEKHLLLHELSYCLNEVGEKHGLRFFNRHSIWNFDRLFDLTADGPDRSFRFTPKVTRNEKAHTPIRIVLPG